MAQTLCSALEGSATSQPNCLPFYPLAGNFNADGVFDLAYWETRSGKLFAVETASLNKIPTTELSFGSTALGDIPVACDFSGDGESDHGVWRPSTGEWFARTKNGQIIFANVPFGSGALGELPAPGDYDGDGRCDLGIWRPSNGYWYATRWDTPNGGANDIFRDIGYGLGALGDKPAPGDYDGDGRWDLGVWRSTNGYWYATRWDTPNGGANDIFRDVPYGLGSATDIPVPGQYDLDPAFELGIWRQRSETWFAKDWNAGGSIIFQHKLFTISPHF